MLRPQKHIVDEAYAAASSAEVLADIFPSESAPPKSRSVPLHCTLYGSSGTSGLDARTPEAVDGNLTRQCNIV